MPCRFFTAVPPEGPSVPTPWELVPRDFHPTCAHVAVSPAFRSSLHYPSSTGGTSPRFWYATPPPPLPALRANLVAKGQQLLAIHMVAPKAPEIFFSFPLPILSTLHPLPPPLQSSPPPPRGPSAYVYWGESRIKARRRGWLQFVGSLSSRCIRGHAWCALHGTMATRLYCYQGFWNCVKIATSYLTAADPELSSAYYNVGRALHLAVCLIHSDVR